MSHVAFWVAALVVVYIISLDLCSNLKRQRRRSALSRYSMKWVEGTHRGWREQAWAPSVSLSGANTCPPLSAPSLLLEVAERLMDSPETMVAHFYCGRRTQPEGSVLN